MMSPCTVSNMKISLLHNIITLGALCGNITVRGKISPASQLAGCRQDPDKAGVSLLLPGDQQPDLKIDVDQMTCFFMADY